MGLKRPGEKANLAQTDATLLNYSQCALNILGEEMPSEDISYLHGMKSARTLQWQKQKFSQKTLTSTHSNRIPLRPTNTRRRLIGNSSRKEKAWCIQTGSKMLKIAMRSFHGDQLDRGAGIFCCCLGGGKRIEMQIYFR